MAVNHNTRCCHVIGSISLSGFTPQNSFDIQTAGDGTRIPRHHWQRVFPCTTQQKSLYNVKEQQLKPHELSKNILKPLRNQVSGLNIMFISTNAVILLQSCSNMFYYSVQILICIVKGLAVISSISHLFKAAMWHHTQLTVTVTCTYTSWICKCLQKHTPTISQRLACHFR